MTAARSSHTFVCEGLAIEDGVFVGHGVVLISDPRPRATIHGRPQAEIGDRPTTTRTSATSALSLRAAGVRARRYERDSALRGVVPADNGA